MICEKKDMGKYDGRTCLAIVFSHVIFGGLGFFISVSLSCHIHFRLVKQESTELTPGVFSCHCELGTKLTRAIWSLHVQRQHVCGDHVLWPKQIMGMGLLQPTLPLNVPTKDLA